MARRTKEDEEWLRMRRQGLMPIKPIPWMDDGGRPFVVFIAILVGLFLLALVALVIEAGVIALMGLVA